VKHFSAPRTTLGDLDAEAAARAIAAFADVAVILDQGGVVRDVAISKSDLPLDGAAEWLGRPWADTVAPDSRPMAEAMLRDALANTPTGWRRIHYKVDGGDDVPILYAAQRLGQAGDGGPVVAVGRDLRAQQRLISAQQAAERDYAKLRHLETRYRLLFKLSYEGVLILNAASRRIVEANPAALSLFGEDTRTLVGSVFPRGMDSEDADAIERLLAGVRTVGRGDDVVVRLGSGADRRDVVVSAALFRLEKTVHFLVRLMPHNTEAAEGTLVSRPRARLLEVLDNAPDGIVLTDMDGLILTANTAFLDFVQVATEAQVRGRPLGRFIGRGGADMTPLIGNLRDLETVRGFATTIHGDVGTSSEVSISGVAIPHGNPPCLGFLIRDMGGRLPSEGRDSSLGPGVPRSVEQLTELVGRVPLKDIIRDTNDVIEKLCIQAALELTGDNRASAAEMLGLSRQSLYVKLRRYNLGDLAPAETPAENNA